MDTALITMWKAPYPGREQKALEFAAESADFWGKQAAAGRCSTPEWFFFPDGLGMWMVKGDRAELDALVNTDDARRLLVRGNLLLDEWQYTFAETGSGAERFMSDYAAALSSL